MAPLDLHSRIYGSLMGAAIGAEMGFARMVPAADAPDAPIGPFGVALLPDAAPHEDAGRVDFRKVTPFIDLGVRAYAQRRGRVTPEDFGAALRDDESLAGPVFGWDGIHTTQELLREGMHPRLSGLGVAPCGHICAAMPAVGIFHFADPEYAYLDGVELASVAQPRLGADWAALCAAAVAAAFEPDAGPQDITATVLRLALRCNKELYYQLNAPVRQAAWLSGQAEERFLEWWRCAGGVPDASKEKSWFAWNPLAFILPLLARYGGDPVVLMTLLRNPGGTASHVSPVIAGAIIGALHGPDVFPAPWRQGAGPVAERWMPLADVADSRARKEREILSISGRLAKTDATGNSLLVSKIHGCLLAGAIGNAMGSPVEGRFYHEVDRDHPGGITTLLDPSRLEGEDDNQMAMLLVETYLARQGMPVMARHFGQTWYDRLNRDHFYMNCMGNSYDLIRQGWDPRITGHWNVVTGSTVMCMEPVGIYHLADPEFAWTDATAVSYMYQRGLDVTVAALLAAGVAEAFRPEATADSVCGAVLDAAPREPLRTFDRRPFESVHHYLSVCLEIAARYDDVLAIRRELCERCQLYHAIDPLELFGFALAMLQVAKGDVRQAAIGGASIGRDADTIAGRAAMLAGILQGVENVPAEWVALAPPLALERIRANAARLAELVAGPREDRLRRRAAVACV